MSDASESLSPEQLYFARVQFELLVHQSNGQRYEDLFTRVMTRRYPGFRQIKPQGPIGDQGNDGFIRSEGRYFQVYAPEDPKSKVDKAAEKARDDFGKLLDNWTHDSAIRHFRFAFNDKYSGSYPTVEHALADIQRTHNLESAEPFLAKDLEREFMQLPLSEMQAVLQTVIPRPEYIQDIDYVALTKILQHLVDNQQPVTAEGLPPVPDFDRKMQFNDINRAAHLLRVGNYQNAAVDQYFDQHGEFTRTDIRNRLAQSYDDARVGAAQDAGDDNALGDRVFFHLLRDIAPQATKPVQDAAIVLVSYFFEKCDVFEDPNE